MLRILVVLIEIRHLDEGREFLINLIKPFLTEGDGRIRRRLSQLQTARNELENVNWLRQRKGKKKIFVIDGNRSQMVKSGVGDLHGSCVFHERLATVKKPHEPRGCLHLRSIFSFHRLMNKFRQ